MKCMISLSVFFNVLVGVSFVALNIWAVNEGLEETFVVFALIYGLVTVLGNAIFVAYSRK